MSKKFIPNGDSEFAWMAKYFADRIAKDPNRYTLSDFDSKLLSRRVREYRDALAAATDRQTRTPATIHIKDEKRKVAEDIVRRAANCIRASYELSTADKLSVGIKERPKKLGKRSVPFAPPELFYQGPPRNAGPNSGLHQLYVREGFTFAGKSKANGATRVELFVDLVGPGDPVPQFPGQFVGGRPWYLRSFSKSPMKVQHPVPPMPMRVVYWARWADAKGNVGPFSKTCMADWVGPTGNGVPMLGAMPEVKVLANDPKYLTAVGQLRQLEHLNGEKMLPDSGERAKDAATPKQIRLDEAA